MWITTKYIKYSKRILKILFYRTISVEFMSALDVLLGPSLSTYWKIFSRFKINIQRKETNCIVRYLMIC